METYKNGLDCTTQVQKKKIVSVNMLNADAVRVKNPVRYTETYYENHSSWT